MRLFACAAALAAMVGQVGGYAHLAFTAHVTCAEHGELIEAGPAGNVAAQREAPSGKSYASDGSGASHGHEHCLLAPHRRDRGEHAFARTIVANAQLSLVQRIVEAVGPPHPIQLILLAPKNSPPV